MSNTSTRIALARLVVLAAPAASFARAAGQEEAVTLPVSGSPQGPANAGGMKNVTVDPSGTANASMLAPLPQPRIRVLAVPHFK